MEKLSVIYGDNAYYMAMSLLDECKPEEGLDVDAMIVIKPNLVVAKPWTSGATTNPELCHAVIEYFLNKGFSNLMVTEGSWVGEDTKNAFEVCGYNSLCEKYNIPLLDTKYDDFITKTYKGYEFEISKTVEQADLIVNLPVIKGHCQTDITCALKNLKGVISDKEKRRFHSLGLHTPIAYLNAVIDNVFTIADGIFGDLDFEEGGNPVKMDTMIASFDRVLIDSYAATLMSYNPLSIGYIDIAHKENVGQLYDGNISALNSPNVTAKLNMSHKVSRLKKYIDEDMACSACVGNLIRAINSIGYSQPTKISVGQGFKGKGVEVGIGLCANRDNKCNACPPTSMQIADYLKYEL